ERAHPPGPEEGGRQRHVPHRDVDGVPATRAGQRSLAGRDEDPRGTGTPHARHLRRHVPRRTARARTGRLTSGLSLLRGSDDDERANPGEKALGETRKIGRATMKRRLLFILIGLIVTGCASLQAGQTRSLEQMLTDAGFQTKPADTPQALAYLQT